MKILLIGTGRMGRLMEEVAAEAGDTIVAAYDANNIEALATATHDADVVIDFSSPAALPHVVDYVRRTGTALLSGTTGFTSDDKATLEALGEVAPVLWSANYSLGIAVLAKALRLVTGALRPDFDIEVTNASQP